MTLLMISDISLTGRRVGKIMLNTDQIVSMVYVAPIPRNELPVTDKDYDANSDALRLAQITITVSTLIALPFTSDLGQFFTVTEADTAWGDLLRHITELGQAVE